MRRWFDQTSDSSLLKCFAVITLALVLPNCVTIPIGKYTQFIFILPAAFYYSLLGYIIHRFQSKFTAKKAALLSMISILIVIILPLASFDIKTITTLTSINYPLCIILSASIFRVFLNFHFSSKLINYLGGLTFGIYLIHDNNYVRMLLWQNNNSVIANIYNTSPSIEIFILQSIGIILCVFSTCAIIEAIRQGTVSLYCKILKKHRQAQLRPPS